MKEIQIEIDKLNKANEDTGMLWRFSVRQELDKYHLTGTTGKITKDHPNGYTKDGIIKLIHLLVVQLRS